MPLPEKVSVATAAVRFSARKVDPARDRFPSATIRIPTAIPAEVKAAWIDDGQTRVQHFPRGLIVVGNPNALASSPPRALAVKDYILGPHQGDVLSLPTTLTTDGHYDTEALNPVSVLYGFEDRALIVPSAALDGLVWRVSPPWALGRIAHAAIAESGRNPIDTAEAVATIGAALTPAVVFREFGYRP